MITRRRLSVNKSVTVTTSIKNVEAIEYSHSGCTVINFMYPENRLEKKLTIMTDIDDIDISKIDSDFIAKNTIYRGAAVHKNNYKGNRWHYENEFNVLGWRLAFVNQKEISGKPGALQRAVDCYRSLQSHMHSRRVSKKTKLNNIVKFKLRS
ncbi:hypothetical protein BDF14DRAFT_1996175 [Spinellus fusiger]|nr:hypothetical protein BDF14DRAFT_1996175 [Spinellus fusiger]